MTRWSEEDMQKALEAIENGQSIRKAGKQFGIPEATLRGRVKGAVSVRQNAADRQLLSPDQEEWLAQWIRVQEHLGQAPTHHQVRLIAAAILQKEGRTEQPGRNWVTGFFERNPSIGTKQGRRLDLQRVKAVNPDRIKALFEVLDGPLLQDVRPTQRWNVDETGLAEGVGVNGKHIGSVGDGASRWTYVRGRTDGAWVSVIECISAGGDVLPPAVIYTGQTLQAQWFDDCLDDSFKSWRFTATPNGYTTDEVGYEWLTTFFIPLTDPGQKQWRLLILDGHTSHCGDNFMVACAVNRIYLCCLPPHSSHISQPLDVGCFAVLKRKFRQLLEKFSYENVGAAVSKQIFLSCYSAARKAAFSGRNIRAGWKATGLWPVDSSKMLQKLEKLPAVEALPEALPQDPPKVPDIFDTPSGGRQLRKSLERLRGPLELQGRDLRVLLRKAAKALDKKNCELAEGQLQRNALELQVKRYQPKRRQKVEVDPNKRFANLGHIQAAQAKAKAKLALRKRQSDGAIEELSGAIFV